jgi:HEAT repeat protein
MQKPTFRQRLHDFFLRPRVARVVVLVKVAIVQAAIVILVLGVHQRYFAARYKELPLSLAVSFLAVQVGLILGQLLVSTAIKYRAATSGRDSDEVRPAIRRYLAEHVAGEDHRRVLLTLSLWHRGDVQRCLTEFLGAVEGVSRARLQELAVRLRFPWMWAKLARFGTTAQRREAAYRLGLLGLPEYRKPLLALLEDHAPHVQTAACRGLLAIGDPDDLHRVMHFVLDAPLLVRAVLVTELGRHETAARAAVVGALRSRVEHRMAAALELAAAWVMPLPLPVLTPALLHTSATIRAAALGMLHLLGPSHEVELWLFAGLVDPEAKVRSAAMSASRRMKLRSAIPAIEALLHGPDRSSARECCLALAAMGPDGWSVLEELVRRDDRQLAAYALSALSAVQVGPAELLEVA